MNTLFVKNGWLPDIGLVNVAVTNGLITAIGAVLSPPTDGSPCLDAAGMLLAPGLVNGHTHAAMTLFRGFGDDMPLMEWLRQRIWPAEARLSEEDVYWGTKLACLEMIRSGTCCFQDMYWHYNGVVRAVTEMGLRAGVGAVLIDVAGVEQAVACKKLAEQMFEESHDYPDRLRYTLAPHAIYTVSEETLRWIADFSDRHDLPVHIHLSETRHEVEQCLQQHGMRPAYYLDRLGLLTSRMLLAHGVYLDDGELDLIGQRGATLVTNPVSNLKLAVGAVFPYQKASDRGIPIAIGTDGAASNNSLDLFQEVKTLALIQKHAMNDPTTLPAAAAWEIVTGSRAPLATTQAAVTHRATLAVGQPADFLLLRHQEIEVSPNHQLLSNLVYAASGHIVDSVVVNGRVLMHQRRIDGAEEIRLEACARAALLSRSVQ
ncbi:MAG: amidohydrolase [Magnetococcales bacterium]|nr:amidohydrolase [Magnetococcales bacterium]